MKTVVVYSRAPEAVTAGSAFHKVLEGWSDEKRAQTRVRYRNADAGELEPVEDAEGAYATEAAYEQIEALYSDENVEVEKLKLEAQEEEGGEKVNASNSAKKLAEKHEIDLSEIEGDGKDGKVTKPDVEAYLEAQEEEGGNDSR